MTLNYDWNDGAGVDLAHWYVYWTIPSINMTITNCNDDGPYTIDGTAAYAATNNQEFDQSAEDSPLYNFDLSLGEDATASIVANHEASGADFGLELGWTLDATLGGQIDVISGVTDVTSVNAAATWTANEWTCQGTWTDFDAGWNLTCTN